MEIEYGTSLGCICGSYDGSQEEGVERDEGGDGCTFEEREGEGELCYNVRVG